ncbi:MAG: UDP-N-acetylmuramate--L-alanine ligase [Anaerolineae bacterium]|nr:UDP-N-acetylmuramate--L-alanine ligase [Anaerolineae bacterium]MDW8171877.1 UDP-N-acetylmuramate--L-alanine ligase [Anaerolineae bacterium]
MHVRFIPGQRIHIIGIGGSGMSAIARILLEQGYTVSGSDRTFNSLMEELARDGAIVYADHDATYVQGAEWVIRSSAITDGHIEVLAAEALGIPVLKRAAALAALMEGDFVVAVAGTHGKTTTTSMLVHVLQQASQDPSYIVGGVMGNTGRNAGVGRDSVFIIEADEYDNMFHGLKPQIEIVTNVEYDHPDFFPTRSALVESFSLFVGLLPANGLLIACADDPVALAFARNRAIVNLPVQTYGTTVNADWQALNVRTQGLNTLFDACHAGSFLGQVSLRVPGEHNALNALAVIAAAHALRVDFEQTARALASFEGTERRFEITRDSDGLATVDDYAHHPTAIRKTIAAARARYPGRQLWAVWQPHTYSRTLELLAEYLEAFGAADHVLVTDIYAARERTNPGVHSEEIVAAMSHPSAHYAATLEDAAHFLHERVQSPAVILVMSAGDGPRIGELFWALRDGKA